MKSKTIAWRLLGGICGLMGIRRREAEANAAREAVVNVLSIESIPPVGDEPFVLPFGRFPGTRGRVQVFDRAEAAAMVAEFNSVRGRLGRMFRGLPIYIGHPDVDRRAWPDERRLGKVADLEVVADGLRVVPEWNSLGRENITEGYWVYPSAHWDAPAGQVEFRPDRLLSIGLTNTPRIAAVSPVANSAGAETPTNNDMDRKQLTEKLGLPETATDEEIMAKLGELVDQAATAGDVAAAKAAAEAEKETAANALVAMTAERDAANERATAAESAAKAAREAHANAVVDAAVVGGRITLAEREAAYNALLAAPDEAAFAAARAALDGRKPSLDTAPLDLAKSRVEIGDEQARREAVANAVATIMERDRCSYEDAWAKAEKLPELAPVWAAMKTPTQG